MNRIRNLPLWAPLASLMLAFCWLLPNAEPPWGAFHKDVFAASVLAAVACAVVFRLSGWRVSVRVDWLAMLLIGFALVACLQYASGMMAFKSSAVIGCLYFGGAALALIVGRAMEQHKSDAVATLLFPSILLACWITSGLMLVQAFDPYHLSVWISKIPAGTRPYGNLMQANNAATLLLFGAAAVFWLRQQRFVGRVVWVLATLYLLGFLVLSASRIGYLSASLLLLLGFVVATGRRDAKEALAYVVLIAAFVILVATRPYWGLNADGADPFSRTLAGHRLQAYSAFLAALMDKPWTGFGFDRSILAQLRAFDLGHSLPGFFGWTHNFLLDVAIWFGIPMALALAAILGCSAWQGLRKIDDPAVQPLMVCMFVFFMHAAVELPHAYAYFLLPTAMLGGALLSRTRIPTFCIPRAIIGAVLIVQIGLLMTLVRDYLEVERSFYAWRFSEARIGTYHPVDIPQVQLLDGFGVLMKMLRTDMGATVVAADIEQYRRAVYYFPSPHAMQHLAVLAARSGQVSVSTEMSYLAKAISPVEDYQVLTRRWGEISQRYPELTPEMWRPLPRTN